MASAQLSALVTSPILRIRDKHEIAGDPICRVTGYLNPANFLSLFEATDLTANPRLPKVNDQVREMWKAIEERPASFHFKNNGILIAASSCEALERNRFRVGFESANIELHPRGILNGGHTTLSCASALIRMAATKNDAKIPKFRMWDEFRDVIWPQWRSEVLEIIEQIEEFLVPIEILYPAPGKTEYYDSLIHEIADARNNNCELTEEAKANHAGYYTELKDAMDILGLCDAIEWRTNTPGTRVNVKEVVALACVPLSIISEEVADARFDLKEIYNSTSKCSAYFNKIYQTVSTPRDAQYVLRDDESGRLVRSAVLLTKELVEIYDWLAIEFPRAYNAAGGQFGNIDAVNGYAGSQEYETRFFQRPCDFRYSDGYFMPILTSVAQLIVREGDALRWKESPQRVLERHLDRMMKTYKGHVKNKNYDGRLVGRDQSSYDLAYETVSMLLDVEQGRAS